MVAVGKCMRMQALVPRRRLPTRVQSHIGKITTESRFEKCTQVGWKRRSALGEATGFFDALRDRGGRSRTLGILQSAARRRAREGCA
jgi:hypothetical protein